MTWISHPSEPNMERISNYFTLACPIKKIIGLPDGDHQLKVWIMPTWTQLQHLMKDVRKRAPHVVIPYALIQIINSYNLFNWLRKKNPRPKYHQEKEYSSRPSYIGYSLSNCTNSFHMQFFLPTKPQFDKPRNLYLKI